MKHSTAAILATALVASTSLIPTGAFAQSGMPTSSEARAGRDALSDSWLVNRRLLAVGAGAVTGVVMFNVLAAPLGTVPLAGAVLDVVPYNVALGSRLIAATTAAGGALVASYAYDKWTGYQSDYRYMITLGAGALAGVAVGNYLGAGMFGYPPYYLGAGVANAGGMLASTAAQAASRVYVIGSAVIGAWVADYIYRR